MRDHAASDYDHHELQKLPVRRSSSLERDEVEEIEDGADATLDDLEEEDAMNRVANGRDAREDGEEEALLEGRRTQRGSNSMNTTSTSASERHGENGDINRRTVHKLDLLLLPFLALLFLLNSLDKSNIGNAETAGFTHDTGQIGRAHV